MTTHTKDSGDQHSSRPWRKRASFRPGKTRRARQEQYRQQIQLLALSLLVASIGGLLIVFFNWRQAGSTRSISCEEYPQYCVPLAGGAEGTSDIVRNESSEVRTLDADSKGAAGVVRGMTADIVPFLGNPDAPIRMTVLSDYACSHCQEYHRTDLKRLINDYVLTGQMVLEFRLLTGTGGDLSQLASQAALCAGEQGAYWEYGDEMFRLASSESLTSAFSIRQLRASAEDMGLNEDELIRCITSGRYLNTMESYIGFAMDSGVTATPTTLVSYGDGTWTEVQRDYNTIADLVDRANAPQ